ncbi:hypothetical protein [Leptolyngbya phage Lbo-JY46]
MGKINKYKFGNINVDPMGYWNRDNYNKPVIIPSNNISMENVPYDVVGISQQTGESKIMKPNKKYHFGNTKSVLEIPIHMLQAGGPNGTRKTVTPDVFEKARAEGWIQDPNSPSRLIRTRVSQAQSTRPSTSGYKPKRSTVGATNRPRTASSYRIQNTVTDTLDTYQQPPLVQRTGNPFSTLDSWAGGATEPLAVKIGIWDTPDTLYTGALPPQQVANAQEIYYNQNRWKNPNKPMPVSVPIKRLSRQNGGYVQNDYWHNLDNTSDFSGLMDIMQQYNAQQQLYQTESNDLLQNQEIAETGNDPIYEDLIARITELESQIQQGSNTSDDVEYDVMFDYIMGNAESGIPVNWEEASRMLPPQLQKTSNKSLEQQLSAVESGGNYRAVNPNSSAVGKYQFLWNTWGPTISKVTGINNKEAFRNSPEAQENFFAWYKQNELLPATQRIKKYNTMGLSDNDLSKLIHYKGEGGAKQWLLTGIDPTPKNNKPIQQYLNHSR